MAEWDTIGESLDALALANHRPIHIVGFAHPFHLKLAFSPKPISDDRAGQSMINYPAPPMQISRGPQLNTPRVVTVPAPSVATSSTSENESSGAAPAPFDVKAVEAEEAAYLANNNAQAGNKRTRTPPQPVDESVSSRGLTSSLSSNILHHQPPKTPEEEDESNENLVGAQQPDVSAFERTANLQQGHEDGASSSELSEDANDSRSRFRDELKDPTALSKREADYRSGGEEDGGSKQFERIAVHQPPATPPSESPSSSSYSPVGDGEN